MDVAITRAVVRFPVEGTIKDGPVIRVGNSETLTTKVEHFAVHFFVRNSAYACSEVTVYGLMGPDNGWEKPATHTYYLDMPDTPQWVLDLVDRVRPRQAAPLFFREPFTLDGGV
jgi:hypothetical protein